MVLFALGILAAFFLVLASVKWPGAMTNATIEAADASYAVGLALWESLLYAVGRGR